MCYSISSAYAIRGLEPFGYVALSHALKFRIGVFVEEAVLDAKH